MIFYRYVSALPEAKLTQESDMIGQSWKQRVLRSGGLVLVLGLLLLCPSRLPAQTLRFLILPVEDESTMYRQFLPVKHRLEAATVRKVKLILGHESEAVLSAQAHESWDLAYVDPAVYCRIRHRRPVRPLVKIVMNGRDEYCSALVMRRDASIGKLVDIQGRRLALGHRDSSSSYLIPLAMIQEADLGLDDFSSVGYLQNEDQVALSVLVGDFDVGALSCQVARKYTRFGLKTLKTSEPIPQFLICAAPHLDQDSVRELTEALTAYDPPADSENALHFRPTADRDYTIVRIMLKNITGRDYLTYPGTALKIGLLPLYSPITLYKRFAPLARYLGSVVDREFRLVIPRDFEEYVHLVHTRQVDFAYQNPYVYLLLARQNLLRPLALTVSPEPEKPRDVFRGVIIVRKDSPIHSLRELKDKQIAIVSSKSAGGYWFQKILFQKKGIDIDAWANLEEGKHQEEVILSVYRREVDAGFVREAALQVGRDLVDMDAIRILAFTSYFPNWPFAAHELTPRSLARQVREALLQLNDPHVLRAARISGFHRNDPCFLNNLEFLVGFE